MLYTRSILAGLLTIAISIAALSSAHVDAGTSGKIRGYVRDAETGESLPGANIQIEGMRRGATADQSGFFVILLVDPGSYSLSASMLGFSTQRQDGVVVKSDYTSQVNFSLEGQTLQGEEIVVTAERPPVEPDQTSSKYVMGAAEIEELPSVRSSEDLIGLQAGVSPDGELSIRAANPEDTAIYIDGVRIPTGDTFAFAAQDGFSTSATANGGFQERINVNRSSIQELTVVTGGKDAEYGNAQGGVISFVTRDGGSQFRGLLDYQWQPAGQKHWGPNVYESNIHKGEARWDDPVWTAETVTLPDGRELLAHPRLDYTSNTGHFAEGNLSGPLARNLSFFTSSKWRREASVFPGAALTTPPNTNTNLKLTHNGSMAATFRAGGFYQRQRGFSRGGNPASFLSLNGEGKNLFLVEPAPAGEHIERDWLAWVGVTHPISPRTIYEVKLSLSASNRDTSNLPTSGGSQPEMVAATPPIRDASRFYVVHRAVSDWRRFQRQRLTLKADLSSQLNKQHHLKAGFESIRYNNWFQRYASSGANSRAASWYGADYGATDFLPDSQTRPLNPLELGLYVQDKIEFEGMIVNAGLRFQSLWLRTPIPDVSAFYGVSSPMWASMTRNRMVPTVGGGRISGLSPRLGVSHPINSKSVLRFYYGKSIQMPTFDMLFGNTWISQTSADDGRRVNDGRGDRDLNGNGVIDPAERWNAFELFGVNPNNKLPPEETTSFEFGFDWNFVTDYVFGGTVYYNSGGNQIFGVNKRWFDPATGTSGNQRSWTPGGWRDTRGFEFSLKKRFADFFSFNLAYNLQWAESGRLGATDIQVWPDSLFVANGHYWTTHDIDPLTGAEVPVSLREQSLREGLEADALIKQYGAAANDAIRSQDGVVSERSRWSWIPGESHYSAEGFPRADGSIDKSQYDDGDQSFWEGLSNRADYAGSGEGNLLVGYNIGQVERSPQDRDRRNFGSMTLLVATPPDFGPLKGKALGNIRANLIYRVFTGTPMELGGFAFSGLDIGTTPMHTRTDLNFEKEIGDPSGLELTFAVEVYNLFQQKDASGLFETGNAAFNNVETDFDPIRYQSFGILGLDPSSGFYKTYGEVHDVTNWTDRPREINFGIRIGF